MNIPRKGYFWFTVVLLVFALVFGAVSLTYSAEARLVPLLVAVPTALLCVVILLSERYPGLIKNFDVSITDLISTDKDLAERFKTSSDRGDDSPRRVVANFGWFVSLFIGIFLVGFLISVTLFTLLYLKFIWRISWLKVSIVTLLVGAIIFGGFELLLEAELYRGILFGAIIPPT